MSRVVAVKNTTARAVKKVRAQKGKAVITAFFSTSLAAEKESGIFYPEYSTILKTIDSVNSFNKLYKVGRAGAKGGPSTHDQQDLYRAMLVFACAGLDVFVKQLVRNKLPKLLKIDENAKGKFRDYVRRGLSKDNGRDNGAILNTLALALIEPNPRDVFLVEYIESMTGDSLQSQEAIFTVCNASGLEIKKIFNKTKEAAVKEAFIVRNEIIHEMDIIVEDTKSRTTAYRTRRQRIATVMEGHTKSILNLAEELFLGYKENFEKYKIETAKDTRTGKAA